MFRRFLKKKPLRDASSGIRRVILSRSHLRIALGLSPGNPEFFFQGFLQIFVHYFFYWFHTEISSGIHPDIPLSIFSEIPPRFAPSIPLEISPRIFSKIIFSRYIVVGVSTGFSLDILQEIFQGTLTEVDPFVFQIFVWKLVKKIERDLLRIYLEIRTGILIQGCLQLTLEFRKGIARNFIRIFFRDFCITFSSD